jgi:hypothetical protein
MKSWFGLNPLDVILGTVAFSTVALTVSYLWVGVRRYRAQKRAELEHDQKINPER